MNAVLTVVWNFAKAHWQALFLVGALAVGYFWYRNHAAQDAAALAQINAAHQAEVDAVNKARADEEAQHQQELAQYQAQLAKIQADYAAAQQQLQEQQTAEQQQIVKQYGTDMSGLAQLLGGKLGFTVQEPPQ